MRWSCGIRLTEQRYMAIFESVSRYFLLRYAPHTRGNLDIVEARQFIFEGRTNF